MLAKLIPTFILVALTKRNYKLRKQHKLPDRWYWADLELLCRGYGGYDLWWLERG